MDLRPPEEMTKEELEREVRQARLRQDSNDDLQALIEELSVHQEEIRQQHQELLESRQEIELSRDRYAELFDLAPVAFVTLDPHGVIVDVNVAGALLLGSDRLRLRGTPFVAYVVERDRRRFLETLSCCRRGNARVRSELAIGSRGPAVTEVELTAKPLSDSVHERQISCALVDIGERKQAERERLLASQEQQRLVAVAELERSASDAKSRFLAMLSHELRTPLTPILFAVDLLELSNELPEALRSSLAMIRRNVKLEARLIDDLLDMTRIERGKLMVQRESVSIHDLLRDAMGALRSESDAKSQTVRAAFRASRDTVLGDAARLRQVFTNLLQNAFRWSPQRGAVAVETMEAGDRIRIAVHDSGPGVPEADRERIFTPFYQADQGAAPNRGIGQGLGLGLAIARGFVEAHGGAIRIADSDTGARFELELPVHECVVELSPERPFEEPVVSGGRVLVVEDDVDSAELLAAFLERIGYGVRVAHSVAEAMEATPEGFDVLVSDLALPDGSGYEVLERLGRDAPIQAVAISGFGSDADRARSHAAGFDVHLVKPVDTIEIVAAIEHLIRPNATGS